MYNIKIENATFPDFQANEMKSSHIYISDGQISEISREDFPADKIIDGAGKIVSPGFIDIHVHEDSIENNGENPFFTGNCLLAMGVTTCLAGNCGMNLQHPADFIGYMKKNGAPINYLMQWGYNSLRLAAGVESPYYGATKYQLQQISNMIEKHKDLGLKGISFGLEYSPGMNELELTSVARLFQEEGHLLSAHYREDASGSLDSIGELISLSKTSGVPMEISHIGSAAAFGYMTEALQCIEDAQKNSIDVMADCYPYSAFCTYIGSPVFDSGCMSRWNTDYKNVILTEGPYVKEVCTEDIFMEARKNSPHMLAIVEAMNFEEIDLAFSSLHVLPASDAIYNCGSGHPRGAGTFPRFLQRYVASGKMTLVEGLKKMTLAPALRLGLPNKGQIKVGGDGDLVIFDPTLLKDKADYINPALPPEGLDYVIVNGKFAMVKGQLVNGRQGKYIPLAPQE